jgi:hypothetical protein
VYVFLRSGTSWVQQAYIKASNTNKDDAFGASLALSENTLAVGAPGEASAATGVDGDQASNTAFNAGAVYVFIREADHPGGGGGVRGRPGDRAALDGGLTWRQQAYIKASNTRGGLGIGERFGTRIALDGDTLAVSAPYETSGATGVNGDQKSTSAPGAGAAYVFVRAGATWNQQAYIKASNTGLQNSFGYSVALSNDLLAVGAQSDPDRCSRATRKIARRRSTLHGPTRSCPAMDPATRRQTRRHRRAHPHGACPWISAQRPMLRTHLGAADKGATAGIVE